MSDAMDPRHADMVVREVATYDEQIALWLNGKSVHVRRPGAADYECCPDFSCCLSGLETPQVTKDMFARVRAEGGNTLEFLMGFLGAAIAWAGQSKKVHIAGTTFLKGRPQ